MIDSPVVVGRLKVLKAFVVTEYFECAAWFRSVSVEPGIYDLVAYPNAAEQYMGHALYAKVPGTVTDACFVSRIGAHYGRDDGKKMIGEQTETHVKIGPYGNVGDDLWNGTGNVAVRFDPSKVDVHFYKGHAPVITPEWLSEIESDPRPDQDHRDELIAEIRRLRALVKRAEWSDGYECHHCGARKSRDEKHAPHCPAFTPDGEVR